MGSRAADATYTVDYAFIIRTGMHVAVDGDRHIEGLFSRTEWLEVLTGVGFVPHFLPVRHSKVAFGTDELLVCRRRDT